MYKKYIKVLLSVLLACILVPIIACKKQTVTSTEELKLALDCTELSLGIGQKETLRVLNNENGLPVEWRAENSAVASVKDGLVSAVAIGETKIYAIVGETTLVCAVTVSIEYESVIEIVLENEIKQGGEYRIRLLKGDCYTFTPRLSGGAAAENATFTMSSDSGALSVSGLTVLANSAVEGARLQITTVYGGNSYSVDIFVTVDEEV